MCSASDPGGWATGPRTRRTSGACVFWAMLVERGSVTTPSAVPPSLDEIGIRLAPFCRRHGVARLEVFGSLARGTPHHGSDIDLLVTFQPGVHLGWDFFELFREIEGILGCKVDLLTRRSVEQDQNPIRRRSILESTREIYAGLGRLPTCSTF